MRLFVIGLLPLSLAACAAPDHQVADRGDPLAPPASINETLGEEIAREQGGEGCLIAGNANDSRRECRTLREAITPPPPPPVPLPPPPLPTSPSDD